MSWLWTMLAVFLTCVFARYHWSRRRLYQLAMKLDGPPSLPLIGCTLPFLFNKTEDLLYKIYDMIAEANCPARFWLGPELIVAFKDPQHVEKILASSKFSHKHDIYEFLKCFLGEGLITSSGPKYKPHKKVIQPIFNLNFSKDCVPVFEKHIKTCVEHLDACVGSDHFNIGHFIHSCTADIIGEILFGYSFKAQQKQSTEYMTAFVDIYKVAFERLVKPWLHPDWTFGISSSGKRHKQICDLSLELMRKVMDELKKRKNILLCKSSSDDSFPTPVIDKVARIWEDNSELFDSHDLWFHMITLYMASQDTIALIVSATCLCLGMYPDYQERVVQEIDNVFGNCRAVAVEDIGKLAYLDMCVKDVFRLFPIAPYILRKTVADQHIDKLVLPKGCGIIIPIYNVHKDPRYWTNPEDFHPDHFLPEVEERRPSSTYIPFSAGPRGCIGKIFANVSVKVMLVHLLRRFEIEAAGKMPDVRCTMDISVRALRGYNVKIRRPVAK
ncbi:cytochrome P450 4C1-like [Tenebrio molitor]|uniref:cytochrome P450 4C1-like n=1 Tax=Tenebrio molitor TaxID=7067 RepID=UPI003624972A